MFFFRNIKIFGGNKYYSQWLLIFQIAALVAALDSIMVLSKPVYVTFLGIGLSSEWSVAATGVTVMCYLVLVDWSVSVFYPNSINELILNRRERANAASWAIASLTLLYCLVAIGVTVCVSFYLRHSSASLSLPAPQLANVEALYLKQQKADADLTGSFEDDIQAVKSAKQSAISKSQAHKELQTLADKGNGWAIGKLKERAKDAAAGFDARASKLQNERTNLLASNAKNFETVAATIRESNKFKSDNYAHQTQTIADFMLFFSIAATGFQCFAGLLIALYRANYNIGNHDRMTPSTSPPTPQGGLVSTTAAPVSTSAASVSTTPPLGLGGLESVRTSAKSVSTAKTDQKEAKTEASVLTDSEKNLEEVRIALKDKIQDVNRECSNYEKRDGTRNGEGETITNRLSRKMLVAAKYLEAHYEAATADIVEQYNSALSRGQGTLTEYKKEKARIDALTPTLFETADKEGAYV